MKRSVLMLLVACLVVGALAGPVGAKKKKRKKPPKPRVVEAIYEGPVLGIAGAGYVCGVGCVLIGVGPKEEYVSIKIEDDAGTPVGAALAQDTNADGVGDIFAIVCGETAEPIAITPGLELTVGIGEGPVVDAGNPAGSCLSAATTGKITATFAPTAELIQALEQN